MAESSRIEELKRRVQMDPASIAFAALAEEYRRAGQFEAAIATCQAGLQRHPAYLSARVTLGRSLIEVGRYEQAKEQLEHVLRLAPENLAAIRGLAEIHHRRGELPETLEQYQSGAAAAAQDVAVSPAPSPVPAEPVKVATPPIKLAVPVSRPESVSPAPVPNPDAAALPGLEAFLAAILRAKDALPQRRS
jgi:tetratricopeptide (TPR) repeat protein